MRGVGRTSIGLLIRLARVAQGWTLDELADPADLNRSTLWRIETGRQQPSRGSLQRISQALNVEALTRAVAQINKR